MPSVASVRSNRSNSPASPITATTSAPTSRARGMPVSATSRPTGTRSGSSVPRCSVVNCASSPIRSRTLALIRSLNRWFFPGGPSRPGSYSRSNRNRNSLPCAPRSPGPGRARRPHRVASPRRARVRLLFDTDGLTRARAAGLPFPLLDGAVTAARGPHVGQPPAPARALVWSRPAGIGSDALDTAGGTSPTSISRAGADPSRGEPACPCTSEPAAPSTEGGLLDPHGSPSPAHRGADVSHGTARHGVRGAASQRGSPGEAGRVCLVGQAAPRPGVKGRARAISSATSSWLSGCRRS